MRLRIFICVLLGMVTLQIYAPAEHFAFLDYDDQDFVAAPQVVSGLVGQGLAWVFTGVVAANWHPVTNLSFWLGHQIYGMNPVAEHSLNNLIHACNTVLLFLALWQLTGATWRSAIVAAIFGWHPLRVESVAWIAERKDVLFMFFMLLSLLCYTWYAQPRQEKTATKRLEMAFEFPPSRRVCYILSVVFFILSFLSKAMVVTFPFLLLMLDYWPLGRFSEIFGGHRPPLQQNALLKATQLLIEKIPFFALTVFFSVLTSWIHRKSGDVRPLGELSPCWRVENATWSYIKYLGQFFWPSGLAGPYPYPKSFDGMEVLLAAMLLAAISVLCILQINRRPYLAVGWFWYLGTMLPVIGLTQFGSEPMADRYTYLPLIGPAISLVWLTAEWAGTKSLPKILATATTVVLLIACILLTRKQVWYWQDGVTLFEHTLAVAPGNPSTDLALGKSLEAQGRLPEAAVHYRIAIALNPNDVNANVSLGVLHMKLGHEREAAARFESVLRLHPDSLLALNYLALMLAISPDARLQDHPRAVKLAEQACELTHYQDAKFVTTLAVAYGEVGRFEDGIAMTQKAIALAQQEGDTDQADKDQQLLQLYNAHQPYQP